MDKEELKKKILTIVRGAMLEADELPFIETTDNIADALIVAGYGDVKEAEHRVEVAERALESACQDIISIMEFIGEDGGVITIKNYVPENSSAEVYLKRAEKELAEEGKDD